MAVEHGIRDPADQGYDVTAVADATSALSAGWQHAELNFALQNIATIADTDSVITALRS